MPTPRRTLTMLLLLLPLLAAPSGRAQTPIYQCIAADGHPVFTDQPCASVQATPAPASPSADAAPSLRPPATTCAIDVAQLRAAVIDAFANRDANRLAGLMLWAGYGRRAAIADIRSLAALMQRPLLGIDTAPADGPARELVVHTAAGEDGADAGQARFRLEAHAGCLWLRQP